MSRYTINPITVNGNSSFKKATDINSDPSLEAYLNKLKMKMLNYRVRSHILEGTAEGWKLYERYKRAKEEYDGIVEDIEKKKEKYAADSQTPTAVEPVPAPEGPSTYNPNTKVDEKNFIVNKPKEGGAGHEWSEGMEIPGRHDIISDIFSDDLADGKDGALEISSLLPQYARMKGKRPLSSRYGASAQNLGYHIPQWRKEYLTVDEKGQITNRSKRTTTPNRVYIDDPNGRMMNVGSNGDRTRRSAFELPSLEEWTKVYGGKISPKDVSDGKNFKDRYGNLIPKNVVVRKINVRGKGEVYEPITVNATPYVASDREKDEDFYLKQRGPHWEREIARWGEFDDEEHQETLKEFWERMDMEEEDRLDKGVRGSLLRDAKDLSGVSPEGGYSDRIREMSRRYATISDELRGKNPDSEEYYNLLKDRDFLERTIKDTVALERIDNFWKKVYQDNYGDDWYSAYTKDRAALFNGKRVPLKLSDPVTGDPVMHNISLRDMKRMNHNMYNESTKKIYSDLLENKAYTFKGTPKLDKLDANGAGFRTRYIAMRKMMDDLDNPNSRLYVLLKTIYPQADNKELRAKAEMVINRLDGIDKDIPPNDKFTGTVDRVLRDYIDYINSDVDKYNDELGVMDENTLRRFNHFRGVGWSDNNAQFERDLADINKVRNDPNKIEGYTKVAEKIADRILDEEFLKNAKPDVLLSMGIKPDEFNVHMQKIKENAVKKVMSTLSSDAKDSKMLNMNSERIVNNIYGSLYGELRKLVDKEITDIGNYVDEHKDNFLATIIGREFTGGKDKGKEIEPSYQALDSLMEWAVPQMERRKNKDADFPFQFRFADRERLRNSWDRILDMYTWYEDDRNNNQLNDDYTRGKKGFAQYIIENAENPAAGKELVKDARIIASKLAQNNMISSGSSLGAVENESNDDKSIGEDTVSKILAHSEEYRKKNPKGFRMSTKDAKGHSKRYDLSDEEGKAIRMALGKMNERLPSLVNFRNKVGNLADTYSGNDKSYNDMVADGTVNEDVLRDYQAKQKELSEDVYSSLDRYVSSLDSAAGRVTSEEKMDNLTEAAEIVKEKQKEKEQEAEDLYSTTKSEKIEKSIEEMISEKYKRIYNEGSVDNLGDLAHQDGMYPIASGAMMVEMGYDKDYPPKGPRYISPKDGNIRKIEL